MVSWSQCSPPLLRGPGDTLGLVAVGDIDGASVIGSAREVVDGDAVQVGAESEALKSSSLEEPPDWDQV